MQTRLNSVGALSMYCGSGEDGEALFIDRVLPSDDWTLLVRSDDNREVEVLLSIAEIYELREWCNKVMVDEGHERWAKVPVPT